MTAKTLLNLLIDRFPRKRIDLSRSVSWNPRLRLRASALQATLTPGFDGTPRRQTFEETNYQRLFNAIMRASTEAAPELTLSVRVKSETK